MTKARTVGAKRRAKNVGRPRNTEAERHPNGDIKRPGPATRDRIRLAETPSAAWRVRAMGLEPTQEALQAAARDARLSTLPGRLNAALRPSPKGSEGKPLLSAAAYRGIMQYGVVYERWARAVGSPRRFPAIASYADPIRGNGEAEPEDAAERVRRASNAFMAAEGVVLSFTGGKAALLYALDAGEEVTPHSVQPSMVRLLEKVGKALADRLWLE